MMAYDMDKGTWDTVEKAVSQDTSPAAGGNGNNGNGNGKGNNKGGGPRISAAGRTMAGFTLAVNPLTGSPIPTNADAALGVVIGGGWIAQKSSTTPSVQATDMIGLVTEADLISIGKGGDLSGSFEWKAAPNGGNGGNNVNANLGPVVGARVVVVPGGTKAVVLGGVFRSGGAGAASGMPFDSLPVIDMVTGAVTIQKTTAAVPNGIPTARYGHCVALSADGNTAYMFGGALVATNKLTNLVYALNLQTWAWTSPTIPAGTLNPPGVRDHQCIVVGDQLLSLLGFNTNGAPASSAPLPLDNSGSDSPIPPVPPIYVLSTTQWSWSTQFNALPGTARPPTPPTVSTDGSKGKINGVAIGFGVVFGLAFASVIGYQVYSHRRRKQEKADTLLLIEMEQRKKDDKKMERDRIKKDEDSPLPPPPTEPYPAHLNNGLVGGYEQEYYSQGQGQGGYYTAAHAHHGGQDPYHNQGYYHHQQQQQQYQQQQPQHTQHSQFAPNAYYTQAGPGGPGAAAVGHDRNPFDYPTGSSDKNYFPPPPPPVASNPQQYVPEEMGYTSPSASASASGYHAGHGDNTNFKVPLESAGDQGGNGNSGGLGVRPAGNKMSFVDSSSAYR
ncbi:hypothetical protein BGW39_006907 [Mortierella sp. 14UC]|nr:hypothetical protein BGW39_006907 [Mortierella sp. 14UC]